jgi:lipopolysaccharide transport system ATP-binding protein
MSELAIKVENLSKKYLLYKSGNTEKSYIKESPSEAFWALKDINFEILKGDSLGIIGHNGAGKSTLLKILSQITLPTTGKIGLKGKIHSLLEIGTGFHPNLSGRENIFLNGSILGMSKSEIKKNFDAIVDFSQIEDFIDVSVKYYSSGMYLRLAFAIAIHLEAEIIMIDEVLAVGDINFQQKCFEKINQLKKDKTILVVSHNINQINSICNKILWLEKGLLKEFDIKENIIEQYLNQQSKNFYQSQNLLEVERAEKYAKELIFSKIHFDKPIYYPYDSLKIYLKLKSLKSKSFRNLNLGIGVFNPYQECIYHLSNDFKNQKCDYDPEKNYNFFIPKIALKPGLYYLNLYLEANGQIQDWLKSIITFEVSSGNIYQKEIPLKIRGLVQPEFSFEIQNQINE